MSDIAIFIICVFVVIFLVCALIIYKIFALMKEEDKKVKTSGKVEKSKDTIFVRLLRDQIVEIEFYDSSVFILCKDVESLTYTFNGEQEFEVFKREIKDEDKWLEFYCETAQQV